MKFTDLLILMENDDDIMAGLDEYEWLQTPVNCIEYNTDTTNVRTNFRSTIEDVLKTIGQGMWSAKEIMPIVNGIKEKQYYLMASKENTSNTVIYYSTEDGRERALKDIQNQSNFNESTDDDILSGMDEYEWLQSPILTYGYDPITNKLTRLLGAEPMTIAEIKKMAEDGSIGWNDLYERMKNPGYEIFSREGNKLKIVDWIIRAVSPEKVIAALKSQGIDAKL